MLLTLLNGEITTKKNRQPASDSPGPEKSRGLRNILDVILLLAGLAAAWFLMDLLMDWLMVGK